MNLTGFIPSAASVTVSATTASTGSVISGGAGMNLRVVNESTNVALVSFSTSTGADAGNDTFRMSVLNGSERIFGVPPNAGSVAVCLKTGTGTIQIQKGAGF